MLRWYWWRINAWSEIGAMIASGVVYSWLSGAIGQLFAWMGLLSDPKAITPAFVQNAGANTDAVILLATVLVTTVVWILATFLTKPEPDHVLESFYRRVRPGGPGWATISNRLGFGREPIPGGGLNGWVNWAAGVVAVYATLFGIGKLIFGELANGLILIVIALVAFAWIARSFRSEPTPPGFVAEEQRAAAD
jgi:Na+/proline symporter